MKNFFISIFFLLIVSSPVSADRFGLFEDRDDVYYSDNYGYAKNITIVVLIYLIFYFHIKNEKKESNLSFKLFKLENNMKNQLINFQKNEKLKKEYMEDNIILRDNLTLYFDNAISKEDLFDETAEILVKEYDEEWDDLDKA